MKDSRIFVFVLTCIMLFTACSRNIEGKFVSDLTVSEAVALCGTKISVVDWLKKTNCMPQYIPGNNMWAMNFRDGRLLYTEAKVDGILYVHQLGCDQDDTYVKQILDNYMDKFKSTQQDKATYPASPPHSSQP